MFNILVPWGEFLVGLGLLLGTFTALAALMGAVMNFSYLLSGSSSTNPEMVLLEVLLLVAGFNASKIGLDRWIIPFLRKKLFSKKSNETSLKQAA
jgi:thiosulfate dehydrogenase (quinone) large subunit